MPSRLNGTAMGPPTIGKYRISRSPKPGFSSSLMGESEPAKLRVPSARAFLPSEEPLLVYVTVVSPPAAFTSSSKPVETFCWKVSWKLEPPPSILPLRSARPDMSGSEVSLPEAFVVVVSELLESLLPQAAANNEKTETMAISQAMPLRFFKGVPSLGVHVWVTTRTVRRADGPTVGLG